MFRLIYVTVNIKNILLLLECRHGDVCAIDQCRRQTLCSTPTRASIRFCIKSSTSCTFSARLTAPYFEINVSGSGLFSGQKSGSSYKSYIKCTFGLGAANDAQNVRAETQLAEKITTSRIYQKQEAQLLLTTGSTRLAVSRGQQTWYHSTCNI